METKFNFSPFGAFNNKKVTIFYELANASDKKEIADILHKDKKQIFEILKQFSADEIKGIGLLKSAGFNLSDHEMIENLSNFYSLPIEKRKQKMNFLKSLFED